MLPVAVPAEFPPVRPPRFRRPDVNRNALLVGLLVVALAVVFLLWMNDRESQDASLDIDIGWADAPAFIEFV